MYENFFGFREKPFKLVPDPDYLFLSQTHEDAMAHLVYAVAQGEGFVEITGEVGTGKTTLCRAFLEKLDENTEAAYIFNPVLDPLQLIKAVNREFGLGFDTNDSQELVAQLNAFLMEKKEQGKNVLLLIDEAQDLPWEVLEQLRLFSNLETTKSKLLQIVLVGQPELTEMLNARQLRQLRQRITLRWLLKPLNLKETIEYIRYRVQKASGGRPPEFSLGAMRGIFLYAKGVPRLVNIACDRALLVAYHLNRRKITDRIVRRALRELDPRAGIARFAKGAVAALLSVVIVLGALFWLLQERPLGGNPPTSAGISDSVAEKKFDQPAAEIRKRRPAVPAPDPGRVTETPQPPPAEALSEGEMADLEEYLWRSEDLPDRQIAFRNVMHLWQTPFDSAEMLGGVDGDADFFQMAAQKSGFMMYQSDAPLEVVRRLDLPAILELNVPGVNHAVYLVLAKAGGGQYQLLGRDPISPIPADERDLALYWSGTAYIPWLNFYGITGTVHRKSPEESIAAVKMLLKDIGFEDVDLKAEYDAAAEEAVRNIQEKHGIPVDGLVGSMTKIVLYNETGSFDMPHLATGSLR